MTSVTVDVMRALGFVVFAFLLFGCPPPADKNAAQDSGATTTTSGACAKFGDRCEFSPGKYGSCVHRDDCTVEPCLVCQSQH